MRPANVLLAGVAVRAALIAWGELQDRLLAVKYTDIDYSVFTDAARYVAQGQSPFLRSTYRYSPLLAYLLLPNVWWTRVWGKVLFAAGDVVVAWQLWRLGQLQGAAHDSCIRSMLLWLYNPFTVTISTRGSCDSLVTVLLLATLLMLLRGQRLLPALLYGLAVHLRIFPIVYAPAIVLFLAHQQLQQQQQQQQQQQRARSKQQQQQARSKQQQQPASSSAWSWLLAVLQQGLVFGGVSGATFLLLGAGFYGLYGQTFLQEAFLHHTTRKDPRHNFSPYYYPIYLDFMPWPSGGPAVGAAGAGAAAATGVARAAAAAGPGAASIGSLLYNSSSSSSSSVIGSALQPLLQWVSGLPLVVDVSRYAAVQQLVLLLVLAVCLHRDLALCWLLQTWAFVAFNKVSTAQYFVWYLSLLPIALQKLPWPLPKSLMVCGAAWTLSQLHWLLWGYLLEFQGQGVHLWLWAAGLLFLAVNTACMCVLVRQCCRCAPQAQDSKQE